MRFVGLLVPAGWSGSVEMAKAHSGGLNAQRCHSNRKTGDYDCHRAPPSIPLRLETRINDEVYFFKCGAARAVGAAPIRVGDSGYRPGLDRDGDGVARE